MVKKLIVIKSEDWSWYKVGEEYEILDEVKYEKLGIQVNNKATQGISDVVPHGHYKIIECHDERIHSWGDEEK